MLCINLDTTNPHFNLALEEYYFRNRKDDFFIVGINEPSIIIGKHQIANEEVNTRFVDDRNVPVIRRISGGGTVYHDTGNVNFTFIASGEPGSQVNFRKHTAPVTEFLNSLEVDARLEGKNDIRTGGLKISGNAEHVFKNRVLHHGTLLFNSSLDDLREALLVNHGQYVSRAVPSNRTSVTNLSELLPAIASAEELKAQLFRYVMMKLPGSELYRPGNDDAAAIRTLAEAKYHSWEWNYAYGPAYRFINRFPFRGRMHCCDLNVKEGWIINSQITGSTDLEIPGREMKGIRHYFRDVENYFRSLFPGEERELALSFF
ncbi:MAG: lipoate--protein ligase [Bacteroidales bacterium]|nr:lipoate--protein ligase [Bacteroidales bacterium]